MSPYPQTLKICRDTYAVDQYQEHVMYLLNRLRAPDKRYQLRHRGYGTAKSGSFRKSLSTLFQRTENGIEGPSSVLRFLDIEGYHLRDQTRRSHRHYW